MNVKEQGNLSRGDEDLPKPASTGNHFYQTFLTRKQKIAGGSAVKPKYLKKKVGK